jgi:hypothetical protein
LIVASGKKKLLIEVKSRSFAGRLGLHEGLYQVSRYMAVGALSEAILFVFLRPNDGTVSQSDHQAQIAPGRIRVLVANAKMPDLNK